MSILFTLKGDWIDGSTEFRRHSASFPDTTEITSSTYRFQKKGLTGEVAKALCSTSSITMLAMTAETGEPIAVPKTLLIVGAVLLKLMIGLKCIWQIAHNGAQLTVISLTSPLLYVVCHRKRSSLYPIYINDLSNFLSFSIPIMYADDTHITYAGSDLKGTLWLSEFSIFCIFPKEQNDTFGLWFAAGA